MDPARKRKIRLVVTLGIAVCLAATLLYTSFSASTEASKPSELKPGRSYEVTGKVVDGSVKKSNDSLRFEIRDRNGTAKVPVAYTGVVPDPFREGREVIVSVRRQGDGFVGEKGSLITKCPSKFTAEQNKT